MTSHELSQKLSQLSALLSTKNEVTLLIEELASLYDNLLPLLTEVLALQYPIDDSNLDGFSQVILQKQQEVSRIVGKLRNQRPGRIFVILDKLVEEIEAVSVNRGWNKSSLSPIREKFQRFYEVYEKTINNYTWPQTLSLLLTARKLYDSIQAYKVIIDHIREDLEATGATPPGNKVASFFFQHTTEYEECLNKLLALDRLYSELCILVNVSKAQYPLRVVKIESGSLWIKIFGEARVIPLLTSLIESAAKFFYRNFTDEGKISSIPRNVEAIESILALTKKLEAEGIDVSASKDNLQKAAVIMSAELNRLLLREPSVEVDGIKISVAETVEDKYLQEGQRLLLDDGNRKLE